jgi:hypothetical protein
MRCPDCGARNSVAAAWCGQCLRRFEAARPAPPAAPPEEAPAPPAERGPFRVEGDSVTWACAVCGTRNRLQSSLCSVCGASLAATLRPAPDRSPRAPGLAALLSVVLPGAGHAYIGDWGQAAARATTCIWVACVALLFALEQGMLAPWPLLFEASALGLWVVSAHDAYREAGGERHAVIMSARTITWVWVGLVMASVIAALASAFAALG